MSTDLIRYDLQVQDALRGVVRKVLADAARDGLPGEHHFYITFRTNAPGVSLSSRLREQYPDEMTIILQYQFWDLRVDDESFEVGLHFKNIPEKLHIPYDAISGFYDPSVQFGLKFEPQADDDDDLEDEEETIVGPAANRPRPVPAPEAARAKLRGAASEPDVIPAGAPAAESAHAAKDEGKAAKPVASDASGEESKVVSIDSFRKKT
ncbi:ClpXP protease specificity-enhancing factor SspB [Rhodoblastus sp. 17X3]|uniref:SspB family protein n=1 Tax=Rhodoblastus sp. 17X3 TaxID=3047026 RepID=UPI0024B7D7AB|nr:ClpXP protease specificity-enhancing factor SspB [Rhodoblastus sp. 17X3]MDI9847660.1 ClpXP protease specificity-enhancing factor SspB [Rhodoblastus sp. 17X3]